jgi:hypothetical protein
MHLFLFAAMQFGYTPCADEASIFFRRFVRGSSSTFTTKKFPNAQAQVAQYASNGIAAHYRFSAWCGIYDYSSIDTGKSRGRRLADVFA